MRMYQGAWNSLKIKVTKDSRTASLRIAAHSLHHKRIFKAICKEKDEDIIQKLLFSEAGFYGYLTKKSNGGELVVTLTLKIDSAIGRKDVE